MLINNGFRLIRYIAHLIDQDEKISVDEMLEVIVDLRTIQWLRSNYPNLDLSMIEDSSIVDFNIRIKDEYMGSNSNAPDNNGLCYLIILLTEVLYRYLDD